MDICESQGCAVQYKIAFAPRHSDGNRLLITIFCDDCCADSIKLAEAMGNVFMSVSVALCCVRPEIDKLQIRRITSVYIDNVLTEKIIVYL